MKLIYNDLQFHITCCVTIYTEVYFLDFKMSSVCNEILNSIKYRDVFRAQYYISDIQNVARQLTSQIEELGCVNIGDVRWFVFRVTTPRNWISTFCIYNRSLTLFCASLHRRISRKLGSINFHCRNNFNNSRKIILR